MKNLNVGAMINEKTQIFKVLLVYEEFESEDIFWAIVA